jgi:predicted AAA+ superfamily ATPase
MLEKNFNDSALRSDKGALFENYVMLELWRNKGTGGELQFYRTSDGAEVDFVMSRFSQKIAVECKATSLTKPISLAGFNHFCGGQGITERYIVNRSLNTTHNDAKILPGFLVPQVRAGQIF